MDPRESSTVVAWHNAAKELGIDVVAPFTFEVDGRRHDCFAWVANFGRARGLVLVGTSAPEFAVRRELERDATSKGYQWSAINLDVYATFDRETFIEALSDWGFTGVVEERPAWLPDPNP